MGFIPHDLHDKAIGNMTGVKILILAPEAHGGFGGISTYNRDLVNACCELPWVHEVRLVLRHIRFDPEGLPNKVSLAATAENGITSFARVVLAQAFERFDLVLCTHLYLLPFAKIATMRFGAPVVAAIYGVEAWQPTKRLFVDRLVRHCAGFISISEFTSRRFREWSGYPERKVGLLPNAINLHSYKLAAKPDYLIARYGLIGKRVILTLGRLDSRERQKGIDELIELMPQLIACGSDLVYLIAGDGDDRQRLEKKVASLGLTDCVRFAGKISEEEKVDHYCLCDVYSMAGRQEGFGFVFLEAMATGAPVVASLLDGSRDAVLNGKIGELANPDEPETIKRAILDALEKPREIPSLLEQFSYPKFVEKLDQILRRLVITKH
jgi:phosphatidyl-myo-inositol dimannoside synthase